MTEICSRIVIALVLLTSFACAQSSAAPRAQRSEQKTESFWEKVLRISGISASPSTLRGPGDEVVSGQIYVVEIGSMKARTLAPGDGYRSPVFVPKSNDILALEGSTIVRIPLGGGAPTSLYAVNAISKLVGLSQDNANELLILRENRSGQTEVGLLSLGTGVVAPISYDPASIEDNHLLEHLRSWDRVYGDKSLYVKAQEKHTLSGIVEYVDVFLRVGNGQPLDVSNCDGANCGQPSLSSDGARVVFIRSNED